MRAVRDAAQAVRTELTATPASGTEQPGHRLRKQAMQMLLEAEQKEEDATRRSAWRAIRELFEQIGMPRP